MSKRTKDKNIVKTSIKQPRELWNRVRTDALNNSMTTDAVLTRILKEHYEVQEGNTHGKPQG